MIGTYLKTMDDKLRHILSGWDLLWQPPTGGPYRLSLDVPRDLYSEPPDWWRRRVMDAAAKIGAVVLPVASQPMRMALQQVARTPAPHVVEVNAQFESVFHLDGKYFLSGYDTQETPKLYFLCRIPRPVATVDEARESLQPTSVKLALRDGLRVVRQGDIFAIESGLKKAAVRKLGAEFLHGGTPIYGTAHTSPADLARLPDGRMLAKKTLIHKPRIIGDHRDPDHAPRELPGRRWWWLTRNTVPITPPPIPRGEGQQ